MKGREWGAEWYVGGRVCWKKEWQQGYLASIRLVQLRRAESAYTGRHWALIAPSGSIPERAQFQASTKRVDSTAANSLSTVGRWIQARGENVARWMTVSKSLLLTLFPNLHFDLGLQFTRQCAIMFKLVALVLRNS